MTSKDHVWTASSSRHGQYLCRYSQLPTNVHSSYFTEQPAVQAPGSWSPKKKTINSASKLKSADLNMRALFFSFFFSTPNEKFKVENKSVLCSICRVFFPYYKGHSPSSEATVGYPCCARIAS